jgi:hypothetical protein
MLKVWRPEPLRSKVRRRAPFRWMTQPETLEVSGVATKKPGAGPGSHDFSQPARVRQERLFTAEAALPPAAPGRPLACFCGGRRRLIGRDDDTFNARFAGNRFALTAARL